MTTIRRMTCDDLFKFNLVNLDPLTETYGMSFYMQYMAHWPEYMQVAESASGQIMGYIMGKTEGHSEQWHGHVTAVTVAPTFRRLGLARKLMDYLEDVSERCACANLECDTKLYLLDGGSLPQPEKRAYFVDLFVRVSNKVAIDMYVKLGYVVYRRVLEYYSGDEDAFDMRKALSRDPAKKSMVPLKHPVRPDELD